MTPKTSSRFHAHHVETRQRSASGEIEERQHPPVGAIRNPPRRRFPREHATHPTPLRAAIVVDSGFSTCDVRSRTFGARRTIVQPSAPPGASRYSPSLSPKAGPPQRAQARQALPSALPASTPTFPGELHASETDPVTRKISRTVGKEERW